MADFGLTTLASYPEAFKVFLGTLLFATGFTGLFYWLAKRWQLLPVIRNRDVHTTRKPRVGGVGMWLAAVLVLIILGSSHWTGLLNFGDGFIGASSLYFGLLGGLVAILLFGLLDDLFGLSALWQLVGQAVAGASLVMGGLTIPYFRLPFYGEVYLAPWVSAVFVITWVVIIINAINLFDGLDGLAGSISLTASVVLFVVSLKLGFIGAATLALLLMGATAGFLPWNWHPSKLFMGTVGSQLLGFMLGTIALISGGKMATAVLVLGIPLFDAVSVVIRRLLAHQSPFQADQRHLHHRLLHIGLTPPRVVLVTNVVAIIFGLLAVVTQQAYQKAFLTALLIIAMFGFIWITYLLERKARRA